MTKHEESECVMKAVIVDKPFEIRVAEVPKPEIKNPDEVLIRVKYGSQSKGYSRLSRGLWPAWSARGASVALAQRRFSAAHVAGKSAELDSRHPSRELCEALDKLETARGNTPCRRFVMPKNGLLKKYEKRLAFCRRQ